MNSPYMGKFQVTQEFKGADHDGLDLVGLHEPAMSFDNNLTGTYTVTPMVGLNVRKGAGMNKQLITTLKWDTKVQCFGYYTEVAGVKWFLIQGNGFEGFVSSQYLVRR